MKAGRQEGRSGPVVGIGMPVYNGSRWIRKAIESILAQTFTDFELVIVDNRSTDETVDICREYERSDSRVFVHENEKNIGAANNFTLAFHKTRGRYFKWASANDLCAPAFLERCVTILDSQPDAVLCYPRTLLIDAEGATVEEYEDRLHLVEESPYLRFKHYLERVGLNNVEQSLMRRDVLERTALQKDYINSDTVLMAEMALRGKFYELPEFLFSRRMARHASTKLHTDEEKARFFQLDSSGLKAQAWQQLSGYRAAIARVPVDVGERIKLWCLWGRMVRWSLGPLWSDMRASLRESIAAKIPR